MEKIGNDEMLDYLQHDEIPHETKRQKYGKKNFIRKCNGYRVGDGDKLFKVCKQYFMEFLSIILFQHSHS